MHQLEDVAAGFGTDLGPLPRQLGLEEVAQIFRVVVVFAILIELGVLLHQIGRFRRIQKGALALMPVLRHRQRAQREGGERRTLLHTALDNFIGIVCFLPDFLQYVVLLSG